MRRFLPHIIAGTLVILFFCVAAEAFAQTPAPPTSAPVPKTGWLGEAVYQVVAWIAIGILSLFGWLTGIIGVLLNFTITYLVVGMGDMILKSGFGAAIEDLWRLVRDLVNLTFIFALLYIGITTIIQGSTSKVKSALASIIISMLLVNFSLYFAKAVIDVGNFTAYTIYRQVANQPGSPGYITDERVGISGLFVHRAGASSLIMSGQGSVQDQILNKAVGQDALAFLIVYTLGSSIFLFMLAFAFAYGAFLLVVRFATLIIVMIFAPIAFLPSNVPALGGLQSRWWKTLLTQSFVAPVYLFGLYVTLLVLMRTPWQTQAGLAALFTGSAEGGNFVGGFQALLFYVIAIVMLMATTAAAKSLAASGAQVSQVLAKAAGKGLAGTAWAGGAIGRQTAGWAGRRVAKSEGLRDKAAERGIGGWAARRALNFSNKAATSTFDVRGSKLVGAGLKQAGIDAGKASKMTYDKRVENIEKAELKYAKDLGERPETLEQKDAAAKAEVLLGDLKTRRDAAQRNYANPAISPAEAARYEAEYHDLNTQVAQQEDNVARIKKPRAMAYADTREKGLIAGWGTLYRKSENKAAAKKIREEARKKGPAGDTKALIDAIRENASKKDE
jgi:hypothetical protein